MSWRTEDSRCGVPSVPRKYFWATMLVAFCDQDDRELDVALLEGVAALLEVRDDRVARLPLDVVERVSPLGREVPREGQSIADDLDVPLFRRHVSVPFLPARAGTPVESCGKNYIRVIRASAIVDPDPSWVKMLWEDSS